MRYVRFGKSSLRVSRIGLDCHALGVAERERGWDPLSYDGRVFAIRTVHAALDAGINLFDTSPDAGGGRAESLLGKALRSRRQGVLIASRISALEEDETIADSVQASTRRLRTETIDIVHVNDTLFDDPEQRARRLDDLRGLKTDGRVHHVGLVVTNPELALPLIDSGFFSIAQFRCDISGRGVPSRAIDSCQQRRLGISVAKSLSTTYSGISSTLSVRPGKATGGRANAASASCSAIGVFT